MNKQLIVVCAIVALLWVSIGIVLCVVVSNTVTVTVNPSASIGLTVDKSMIYSGEEILLTATLSVGVPDQDVTFLQDGAPIGTVHSSGGIATKTVTLTNSGTTSIAVDFTAQIP